MTDDTDTSERHSTAVECSNAGEIFTSSSSKIAPKLSTQKTQWAPERACHKRRGRGRCPAAARPRPNGRARRACLQRHERRTPLPRAAALLAGIVDDGTDAPSMRHAAATSSGSPPSLCACPPLLAETESGAPSLQGSRLAQRWLAGVAARQALDGDDHPSTSMLDLQKLCEAQPESIDARKPAAPLPEASPSSVSADFSFWPA